MLLLWLVIHVGVSLSTALQKGLYTGYQVWSVVPKDDNQVEALRQLGVDDEKLDYWKEAHHTGEEAQIMVPSTRIDGTRNQLRGNGFKINILTDNVEGLVSGEMSEIQRRLFSRHRVSFDYDEFHSYEEIMKELSRMVKRCRADLGILCDTYTIGQTFEGRAMTVFRMYKDEPNRPVYWIDSLIHPREWLAGATNLKIADHLIMSYAYSAGARALLDDGDWHFLFVYNPDGYVYTWTIDRYWRKNRYDNSIDRDTNCKGVDLNRNFEFRWGNAGTSYDPCRYDYRGLTPASEIETKNVQNEIKRLLPKLKAFVSIHAYGRMLLSPFGSVTNTSDPTSCEQLPQPERSNVELVINSMKNAIEDTFDPEWIAGSICTTIYPASGCSSDFLASLPGGTGYAYGIEVRGTSKDEWYGFTAPSSEINPSFLEIKNALVAMVKSINEIEKI